MSSSLATQFQRAQFVAQHIYTQVAADCEAAAAFLGLTLLHKRAREACRTRKGVFLGICYLLVAVAVLSAAVWAVSGATAESKPSSCPAPTVAKKAPVAQNGPTALYAQALTAKGANEWTPAAAPLLKKCVAWTAPKNALPPLEEIRSQLKCQAALIKSTFDGEVAATERQALVERTRFVLGAMSGISQRCSTVNTKLKGISAAGAAVQKPTDAVVSLGGLANFEGSVREAGQTLQLAAQLLHQHAPAESTEAMSQLASARSQLHGCVFKTVREARRIAHSLPLNNPAIRQVQTCRSDMLAGLERLAMYDFEADLGSVFFKGLLMSEIATAPATAPLFGAQNPEHAQWTVDADGLQVPQGVAFAEQMMQKGLDTLRSSEVYEASKSMIMQLAAHGKMLTHMKQYDAAEQRYRTAVEVARKYQHTSMESSALAQLSYFLSQHGSQEQALEAATASLALGDDALASYLQASLRLSLGGELLTEEQVRAAAAQLAALRGKLPTEELEQARAAALAQLEKWGAVAEDQSFSACFGFDDAAQMLICTAGKLAQAVTAV